MTGSRPSPSAVGLGVVSLIVLAFFADVLVAPGGRVLSCSGTDVWRQFAGWRAFGFGAARAGDFPLWNPFVYGGMPYFTGFQSALLYPVNALFLTLPLLQALNVTIVIHVLILAGGTYLWMVRARLHPAAAAFGSLVVTFGGAHFEHVYAGHLPNLCVMAWAPWLFLVIEGWRNDGRLHWLPAGAAIFALQVFAGHPQYVYYSAIAAVLLAVARALRPASTSRARFALGLAAMFLLGTILSAVQWLPAILTLPESVRSAKVDAAFAGSFSFPPENLLTTFLPRLLGDGVHDMYWGRWLAWECCAYVGLVAVVLMAVGLSRVPERGAAWTDAALALALGILALGMYTPLFRLAVHALPGWSLFRGTAKLAFFATLFAARLAARGADAVFGPSFRLSRGARWSMGAATAGLLLAGTALAGAAAGAPPAWWAAFRHGLSSSGPINPDARASYFAPDFVAQATSAAGWDLLLAGAKGAGTLACLLLVASRRRAAWALLTLGALELVTFAVPLRQTFPLASLDVPEARAYRRENAGDFRVLDQVRANGGLLSGLPDVWGDDPGVLRRYAEFFFATQSLPLDAIDQSAPIRHAHPRWDLLRFRAALLPRADGGVDVQPAALPPLRRFEVVPDWEVRAGRNAVLARVLDPSFDPRRTVVLEAPVERPPAGGDGAPGGEWEILREGVDDVVVRVQAPAGGVLLMTDPYCRGWTARAAGAAAPQARYDLVPADWAFRAIPLVPGSHEIRIRYRPPGLALGAVLSSAGVLVLAAFVLVSLARGRRMRVAAEAS